MPKISFLVVHNRYRQPGGEDAVVRAEVDQLRARGHRVIRYTRDNSEIAGYGLASKAFLPLRTTFNPQTYTAIRGLIARERPDIVHIHNFFPLISPAAHYAAKSSGVPVLQTLHNYRLVCPAATLFARGEPCRQGCSNSGAGLLRACYRNSRLATAGVSMMLQSHRLLNSWNRCIDAYLVPSKFCRDYFADAGLPAQKMHVQPNFLEYDPGHRIKHGDYALFVGRLSPEKGVLEMVQAWEQLPYVPLLLAGDGPLQTQIAEVAARTTGCVKLLGQLDAEQTIAHIKRARFLVFPSRWYEPFGMALLEAAACGVPAIASRIGAVAELVADGKTGLLFDPDNFDELVANVRWGWSHPAEMDQMGNAARQLYLEKFTAETSYQSLMSVCRSLLN